MVVPSSDHISKMESSKSIDCTILKSLKVPKPGHGVVFIVITLGSISKKELYEVTILDIPAYTCRGFWFMYNYALGNPSKKWILCKRLYFVL